jgi:hypothetical protein
MPVLCVLVILTTTDVAWLPNPILYLLWGRLLAEDATCVRVWPVRHCIILVLLRNGVVSEAIWRMVLHVLWLIDSGWADDFSLILLLLLLVVYRGVLVGSTIGCPLSQEFRSGSLQCVTWDADRPIFTLISQNFSAFYLITFFLAPIRRIIGVSLVQTARH